MLVRIEIYVHGDDEHPGTPRTPASAIEIGTHSPSISIVTLRGEHDLHSWSEVTLALANASQRPGVVVDLSACTFLDSTMLTVLLVAAKQLRKRDGALTVAIARGSEVRRIFEIMNVDTLVAVHETREAAIAALPGSGADDAFEEPAEAA
jgi:anti-sigma B factor antagonist